MQNETPSRLIARMSQLPVKSKQPRFTKGIRYIGGLPALYRQLGFDEEPGYWIDTRLRDLWLQRFSVAENHFSGVLNSMIEIDMNRGWTVTGGKRQATRVANLFHFAEGGKGMREHIQLASRAYYTTNLGAVLELAREEASPLSPVVGINNVDPTRCRLTGFVDTPLEYTPIGGGVQLWNDFDYERIVSMPSIEESMMGIGYCAAERCMTLVKLMIAVMQYDKESLGAEAPAGFMTISGIEEEQFNAAMEARKVKREEKGFDYYQDVVVLMNPSQSVDLKMVSLSKLPDNFVMDDFIQILMQGVALAFGMDAAEFYSVKYQPLTNAGTHANIQDKKAAAKGEVSFPRAYQTAIQRNLPESILMEFDERDSQADKINVDVRKAEADLVKELYESGLKDGVPLITRDEARQMLIEAGVAKRELLGQDLDNVEISDEMAVRVVKERLRGDTTVQRAAYRFPDEPIVRIHGNGQMDVLWRTGDDMLRQRVWQINRRAKSDTMAEIEITPEDVMDSFSLFEELDPKVAALLEAQVKNG